MIQNFGTALSREQMKNLVGGLLPGDGGDGGDPAQCSCANGTKGSTNCKSCSTGPGANGNDGLWCDGNFDKYC